MKQHGTLNFFLCSICQQQRDIRQLAGAKDAQKTKELNQLLASYKRLIDELYNSEINSLLDESPREAELKKTIGEVYAEIEKYKDMMICSFCLREVIDHAKEIKGEDLTFYCVICRVEYEGIPNQIHLDNKAIKVDPRELVDICDNCARYARRANVQCPLVNDGDSDWKDIDRKFDCFCPIPEDKRDNEEFWKGK